MNETSKSFPGLKFNFAINTSQNIMGDWFVWVDGGPNFKETIAVCDTERQAKRRVFTFIKSRAFISLMLANICSIDFDDHIFDGGSAGWIPSIVMKSAVDEVYSKKLSPTESENMLLELMQKAIDEQNASQTEEDAEETVNGEQEDINSY
jgi:hypothetical protein